jgi:hypothetical protein
MNIKNDFSLIILEKEFIKEYVRTVYYEGTVFYRRW